MTGRSKASHGFNGYCRELMCLAQGHNTDRTQVISIRSLNLVLNSLDSTGLNHCAYSVEMRQSRIIEPRYEKTNNVISGQVRH